jgi:septum formation protein
VAEVQGPHLIHADHIIINMLSNLKKYHIILASKSPRRQELLRGMGVDFEILTKETPEDYPSELPLDEVPKYLSLQKSLAFSDEELPFGYLLITSDTVVICEGEILGKPKDRKDAERMLRMLSGKTHHVVTGVTVRSSEKTESFAVRSNVTFAQLDAEEIDYYIERYKPYDKAGAYGIQEWIGYVGISGLEGSFYNVMGLPTRKLYQCLKTF